MINFYVGQIHHCVIPGCNKSAGIQICGSGNVNYGWVCSDAHAKKRIQALKLAHDAAATKQEAQS